MKTQNILLVVLVLCFAVCVGLCRADLVDDAKTNLNVAKEDAKENFEEAKAAAAPTFQSAKDAAAPTAHAAAEKSESFGRWFYGKISNGLGMKKDDDEGKD